MHKNDIIRNLYELISEQNDQIQYADSNEKKLRRDWKKALRAAIAIIEQ